MSLVDITLRCGVVQDQSHTVIVQVMEKIVCKVKGFTLNHENSQYINQQTMRQIIEGHKKQITTVNEQMIFRNSQTKQIENRYQEKDFRLCYDKRIMKKNESGIETFPYGF